jgi:hypothetical protein
MIMADVTIPTEELDPKEKRQFWEDHVQAWQHSGLTQAEYCRQNNLKNHRWWYWRKRISHPPETDVTFVPLNFSSSKLSRIGISVVTPNGYRIECDTGFDVSKLRQLILAVRGL